MKLFAGTIAVLLSLMSTNVVAQGSNPDLWEVGVRIVQNFAGNALVTPNPYTSDVSVRGVDIQSVAVVLPNSGGTHTLTIDPGGSFGGSDFWEAEIESWTAVEPTGIYTFHLTYQDLSTDTASVSFTFDPLSGPLITTSPLADETEVDLQPIFSWSPLSPAGISAVVDMQLLVHGSGVEVDEQENVSRSETHWALSVALEPGVLHRFESDLDINGFLTQEHSLGMDDFEFDEGYGIANQITFTTTPWLDLGSALAGTTGKPVLAGSGPLTAGSGNSLDLTNALASTVQNPVTTNLVLGLTALNVPFKDGTMVPHPDFLYLGLSVGAAGAHSLPFTWPGGIPAGTKFWVQHWVMDSGGAGSSGFAASNGLEGTAQ